MEDTTLCLPAFLSVFTLVRECGDMRSCRSLLLVGVVLYVLGPVCVISVFVCVSVSDSTVSCSLSLCLRFSISDALF